MSKLNLTKNNKSNPDIEDRLLSVEKLLGIFDKHETNPLSEMYDDFIKRQQVTSTSSNYYYVGQSQRTSASGTGNQSITGIGFKPKLIKIHAFIDGYNKSASWGSAKDGGNEHCQSFFYTASGNDHSRHDFIIYCEGSSTYAFANMVSYDANGFTINWQLVNENCYFQFECFA